MIDPQRVLEVLGAKGYRPTRPARVARLLGLAESERVEFDALLDRLLAAGQVIRNEGGDLLLPGREGLFVGTFKHHPRGFGFVRLPESGRDDDIYVPENECRDAATGDTVVVKVRSSGGGRRGLGPAGAIVSILARSRSHFVGVFVKRGASALIQPEGNEIHGELVVRDAGVRGAVHGDKVVFEITSYPRPFRKGEAVVTEVLGPNGAPGVETLGVIRAFELPEEFPEPVLAEARQWVATFGPKDLIGREDLTHETIVTIDPVSAKDYDDAISLARTREGGWELGVHIADVSHFVRRGSLLDGHARLRGTSVYLPTRVLPMLPEVLSNGLCSLQEGQPRLTKSAFIQYAADGRKVKSRLAHSVIRATQRLTYQQVGAILAGRRPASEPVKALLERMAELARLLYERRLAHGALELDLPDVELQIGPGERVVDILPEVRDFPHQIIEEFMLAANEVVAEFFDGLGLCYVRRIHPPPEPEALEGFARFAAKLGYKVPGVTREALQRAVVQAKDSPAAPALNLALLKSMKRAEYSPRREEHYALAMEHYCHFTSPIRRYPDLHVHHVLDEALRHGRAVRQTLAEGAISDEDRADVAAVARHATFTERRAEDAERTLTRIKTLEFLTDKVGHTLDGIVSGVQEFGLFIQSTRYLAEGLVHVREMTDDHYELKEDGFALVGRETGRRFHLGQAVTVRISHVDVPRRQLDFELVEAGPTRRPVRPPRPAGRREPPQRGRRRP
jgi:ribonuclease R